MTFAMFLKTNQHVGIMRYTRLRTATKHIRFEAAAKRDCTLVDLRTMEVIAAFGEPIDVELELVKRALRT